MTKMRDLGRLKSTNYSDTVIRDEKLKKKLRTIGEFYLSIPADDVFYEMRKKAGLDTKDGKSLVYGDSWFEEGGIVFGQWLQAFCRFYVATKDKRYYERAREYVDGLAEMQKVVPDCYICRTAYMAEKVFHGLMDAVELCGISEAYPLCKALIDHFRDTPVMKNALCRLGDNGTQQGEHSEEIEWYTLSEAIYRFADMASAQKESEDYVAEIEAFGKRFEYDRFWNIFLNGESIFDYSPEAGVNTDFFHAYSHLNSFNSAAYIYNRTGEERYLEAAKNFNAFMTRTQMVATGGYGVILEWLLPKDRIVDALLHCHCTFENQCNTYASLRQNRFLATATGDLKYGNQSELLYYNSFLASLETDSKGHAFYYSDYCADGGTKWLHTTSWTCCSGTRPLAALEILRSIYFMGRDDSLYVNLFISSEIQCRDARVVMDSDYTGSGKVVIRIVPKEEFAEQALHIRRPSYLSDDDIIRIEGAEYTENNGMLDIVVKGKGEQEVVLHFPRPLYQKDIVAEKEGARAFLIGPVVLAAEGAEQTETPELEDFIRDEEGRVSAGSNIFKPFEDYKEHEEYRMHFRIDGTDSEK